MAGNNVPPESGLSKGSQAETALEIIECARGLRQKADIHGFRMLSYLLDLVALEAQDTFQASRDKGAGG